MRSMASRMVMDPPAAYDDSPRPRFLRDGTLGRERAWSALRMTQGGCFADGDGSPAACDGSPRPRFLRGDTLHRARPLSALRMTQGGASLLIASPGSCAGCRGRRR